MNSACRKNLIGVQPAKEKDLHAGLMRDRWLRAHKPKDEEGNNKAPKPEEELLDQLAACTPSLAYQIAFERWKQTAEEQDCLLLTAVTAGSLAVGLGNASPLEIGLTIHHTYGMPVIPGSAVKGLCVRAASQSLKKEERQTLFGDPETAACTEASDEQKSKQAKALFGTPGMAACTVFHDAWYDPEPQDKPFHRDVVTVHHQKYYSSHGKEWPTDFDNPTPVPFLVVSPGTKFLFTVQLPAPDWREFMVDLLTFTLTEVGVGGKTNAGYGRFDKESIWTPPPPPKVETWENCTLTKNIQKGAVTVKVECSDKTSLTIPQSKWQPLERTLAPEIRARFKKSIRATVDVQIENGSTEVTRIEPSENESG